MQVTHPTEELKLPQDIQASLEQARNKISLLDAEVKRLLKLKVTTEKELTSVYTQKVYQENILASLKLSVEEKNKAIEEINTRLVALHENYTALNKKIEQETERISAENILLHKERKDIDEKKTDIAHRMQELQEREKKIASEELYYRDKVKKLRDALT